jgi:aminotransferase
MINLSSRLKHIDSSEFREVFTRLQNLKNPVDLSVGVPEELTPQHIKQAGIKAIKENKTVYTTRKRKQYRLR